MIGSVDDFKNRLKEIDILIIYAQNNQRSIDKYKLFNKTAIVLLCSHFEVFVEAFLAEHVDCLKACYNSVTMPQYMKDNFIDDTFKAYKDIPQPSKKQRPLKALFQLHGNSPISMSALNDLLLEIKYGFGKHGQAETDKLFKKFGFDVFVNSAIYQDAFRKINSAISIRNNIIHEGSAPTLSHTDVVDYKKWFLRFANGLEQHVLSSQANYYGKVVY